eukprot:gene7305-8499_t
MTFACVFHRSGHGGVGPAGEQVSAARYFEFSDNTYDFIIKLEDPVRIQQALDIISGVETENIAVKGKIIKSPRLYNWEWNYHLEPSSITFFSRAAEACDAGIAYVDEHLAEVGGELLPGNIWCPWWSHVVREVHPWFTQSSQ